MSGIPQSEFEAILAARGRGLAVGLPPVEATLAGARRRVARRRAVTAVVGVAVVVGAVGGLGLVVKGSAGTAPLPPGLRSSPVAPESSSATSATPSRPSPSSTVLTTVAGPRQVPSVTLDAGPGSGPAAPDGREVMAAGTSNGQPWLVTELYKADPAGHDPEGGTFTGSGPCLELTLWFRGWKAADGFTCMNGAISRGAMPQNVSDAGGQDWLFLIPEGVVKVAWIGTDGFRQEMPVLPARSYGAMGRLGLAVFPNQGTTQIKEGDRFVGYDAAGNEVGEYMRIQPGATPGG